MSIKAYIDRPFRAPNCLVLSLSATASKIHPPTIASISLLIVGVIDIGLRSLSTDTGGWTTLAIFHTSDTRPSRKMFSFALSLTNNQISIFNGKSHCCTTPELCRRCQRIFIHQLHNFYIAEIWVHSAIRLLKLLCKSYHFPRRYKRKQKWAFFIETPCVSKFSNFLIKMHMLTI